MAHKNKNKIYGMSDVLIVIRDIVEEIAEVGYATVEALSADGWITKADVRRVVALDKGQHLRRQGNVIFVV